MIIMSARRLQWERRQRMRSFYWDWDCRVTSSHRPCSRPSSNLKLSQLWHEAREVCSQDPATVIRSCLVFCAAFTLSRSAKIYRSHSSTTSTRLISQKGLQKSLRFCNGQRVVHVARAMWEAMHASCKIKIQRVPSSSAPTSS